MKKFAIILLFINGIFCLLNFIISLSYNYSILGMKMFTAPFGFWVTIVLSAILFFFPGTICIFISYRLKKTNPGRE